LDAYKKNGVPYEIEVWNSLASSNFGMNPVGLPNPYSCLHYCLVQDSKETCRATVNQGHAADL